MRDDGCCAPAAAVTDVVTIHYRQLGACNGFGNGTNLPNRIFIDLSPRAFTSTQLNLAQFNPFYAQARFVAKGATETINGAVIAVVSTVPSTERVRRTTPPTCCSTRSIGGQGVIMAKDNASQTTFAQTPDCTTLRF